MAEIRPQYIGNEELLTGMKTAFLAPGRVSPLSVLPTYDWAAKIAADGGIIVSGFSSALEKDVWRILVESGGSMILVLVRGPYAQIPDKYRKLIEEGRLLIVFLSIESRPSRWGTAIRNRYVCKMADRIVFPCMNTESSLYGLYSEFSTLGTVDEIGGV